MNSFFPNSIKCWNQIDSEIRISESTMEIKTKLISLIRPQKKTFYNIHDPKGIKILFQLRLELSQLKAHKHKHNFQDIPNDLCDCLEAPENISHFLFECRRFTGSRALLIRTTDTLLRNHNLTCELFNPMIYLYGHSSLSTEENREVLLATINYIVCTKRFQNS